MANDGGRILFIRELEIVKIAPTKESRFRLKITAGDEKQKTEVIKIDRVGVLPKWTQNLTLDFDSQAVVLWELYGRRWMCPHFKVLGSVEKTLGELFGGTSTSADIHLYNGSSEVAVLKISCKLGGAKGVMIDIVPNIEKPSENSELLDSNDTLDTVLNAVKQMIDTLADVHPAATIAWGFLSVGFKVLKNQRDTKDAIRDLYKDMISVYEEFSKDDILEQRDRLKGTYSSLFKQTIECAMFIEGYAKKSGIEHLFATDVSGQAEKFRQAFADLKCQLSMKVAKESIIVTLGVQNSVDILIVQDRLRELRPFQKLGPKSKCMQGTRVETINTIMSWIVQCNSGTMWCTGLAGTGKSSLMGTLHDLLTTDIGGRSRLAAFVRYDRIEHSNASKLITSIAYALGIFDNRIGMAIYEVLRKSPSIANMLDPSTQFQQLLRNPLESLPDLVEEGPLVVIVDGVDECDASNELLVVLAEGFGPKLPFMRLIVASRPVQRIATAFKGESRIYTLHLDTSSKDVDRDIQFYLELQFAAVDDKAFQEKCKALRAIKKLAARASGLFIWAATVAKFVHVFPGTSRLEALLATNIPSDATEALTALYRTTLDTLVSEIKGANADIKKYVRNVLGAVLVAETPTGMTEEVLDSLVLDKGSPPSHHIVSMLGSVLIPETKDSPIRLIHKSFDDFLQDRTRCGDEWFVDVTLHRQEIAKQCLAASKSFLQKWSPTVNTDDDVDIPEYICRYALFGALWHINAFDESGLELLASFFRCCFLPWLDVLLCIKSRRVLSSLSLVLNWSNQFGNTESRTLFHHAYLFAYRALQDGGRSYSGPSYIYTHAMSLSPSSNIIRKAWEQLNVSDSPPVSPDKERLLAHIILDDSEIRRILFPDSNSIMTLQSTSSLMITQREIDTAQQRSSPEICPSSIFGGHSTFIVNRSVIQFECKLTTPPSPSEWIILPLHDDVSQETIDDPSWLYMGVFSSRTRTFKMYTLLLSHFSSSDFSISLYDNGIVLALKTGFFMKISIDQEDNFTWTSIPAYQKLDISPDGSIIVLNHDNDTIQLYDAQTGAAVFGPLHANRQPIGVSDDGSKIVLRGLNSDVTRVFDMALGGKVIAVLDDRVEKVLFFGESKIAYELDKCLIIQSLETGNILFHHGIPEHWGLYHIDATPDGARVVTYDSRTCMVWDVGDL